MEAENFTVKEIVTELLKETKGQSLDLSTIKANIAGIHDHLGKLNSKVAAHEKQLNEHSNFITKVTAYATLGATAITLVVNKVL